MMYIIWLYALRIQNTIESDPHSYKATKAVVKEAQKKICFWSFKAGCDLRDTGAMLSTNWATK